MSTETWRTVLAFGALARARPEPTGEIVFEIVSVTKIFTALAMMVLAGRGVVDIDEPVSSVLPERVRLPERDGTKITLRHLSMHTSGLPAHPRGIARRWLRHPTRPYAGLDADAVYRGLARTRLRNRPGTCWCYSNLGMGLLGMALEQIAAQPFDDLVTQLISNPLELERTGIRVEPGEQAAGYGLLGGRLPNGSYGALAGAGDLRSSADDLLRFARLGFGEGPSELVEATHAALSTRFDIGDGSRQAIGWRIWFLGGDEWPGHGGSSAGSRSSISLHPATRTAVVALAGGRRGRLDWFDDVVPAVWRSLRSPPDADGPALRP